MYSVITGPSGTQPLNDWFVPDTTQRSLLGTVVTAVDPYWGHGKFMYVKSTDAILKGSLCAWDQSYNAGLLPSAVTQGFPWGVAMAPMPSGTFGWIQLEGRAVYKTNATVAADGVVAIAAAGILGATATGKQLIGVRNRVAATGTVTATVNTVNGSSTLTFRDGYDGFFLGLIITGTGIAAATTLIAKLDPDGRTVYAGSAIGTIDKPSTATGTITLTGTYTGFGSGMINNPGCMQIVA